MLLYQQNNRSCVFAVVPLTVEISPSLEKRFVFVWSWGSAAEENTSWCLCCLVQVSDIAL